MAGQVHGAFPVKLSLFLQRKLQSSPSAEARHVLRQQYVHDGREQDVRPSDRRRHYEAEVRAEFEGRPVRGLERLYARSIVVIPTTVCAAHCRWCIRGQYDPSALSPDEIITAARYIGQSPDTRDVREVLVTGGDPLMDPGRLDRLLAALDEHAPRVRWYRLATRVPLQDPERIDRRLLDIITLYARRTEIALHINHPAELFDETRAALAALAGTGARLYNQTVLLRGLNDNIDVLAALLDELRQLGIEMHYLFHCAPIVGMHHHRTTVAEGLALVRRLDASGAISGRIKPRFALLTDIGKIMPYEGAIVARSGSRILVGSHFSYDERRRFNPSWRLPPAASVSEDGMLQVWYEDAEVGAAAVSSGSHALAEL